MPLVAKAIRAVLTAHLDDELIGKATTLPRQAWGRYSGNGGIAHSRPRVPVLCYGRDRYRRQTGAVSSPSARRSGCF